MKWSSIFENIAKQIGSNWRKKGNFSAGVKARQSLRKLKKLCKDVRSLSLKSRDKNWGLNDVLIDDRPDKRAADFTASNNDPKNGYVWGWSGWKEDTKRFLSDFSDLNNDDEWGSNSGKAGDSDIIKLADELHAALMAAAESGWKAIKYPSRRNETAAQRFRTETLKIEKLAARLIEMSAYVGKLQKDEDFVAAEFTLGSLVSRSEWRYSLQTGTSLKATELGVVVATRGSDLRVLWSNDNGERWTKAWRVRMERNPAEQLSERAAKIAS